MDEQKLFIPADICVSPGFLDSTLKLLETIELELHAFCSRSSVTCSATFWVLLALRIFELPTVVKTLRLAAHQFHHVSGKLRTIVWEVLYVNFEAVFKRFASTFT